MSRDYLLVAYEPRSADRWPRSAGLARDLREELTALAVERGLGETLTVHGGMWGAASVVVAHPRQSPATLVGVRYDPLRYPTIEEICRFVGPNDHEAEALAQEAELRLAEATGEELLALERLAEWSPLYPAHAPDHATECAMRLVRHIADGDWHSARRLLDAVTQALAGASVETRSSYEPILAYARALRRAQDSEPVGWVGDREVLR